MARWQNPVIVVPGITGTTLHDDYPLQTLDLWTMILNRDHHRLSLHPDDLRYEAFQPAHVYAGRLFSIYNDLIEALRHELSEAADRPTPVFAFPYDWRRDIRDTAVELRDFVEEVVARTKLLRHYRGYDADKGSKIGRVDLVGHSMGGLLICEYLHQFGSGRRVGKVATLGTPFWGSIEAVVKLATGLGSLSGSQPSERERETARSTPAVYQLLPSYAKSVVGPDGRDVDIFNPNNWQPSILQSLAEYVRLHSVTSYQSPLAQARKAKGILASMLKGAQRHRRRAKSRVLLSRARLQENDWLAIIGVGERTRLQVKVKPFRGKPRFDFTDTKYVNEWKREEQSRKTGDGTVPLNAALPPFLSASKPVTVCRGDFGVFELGDRLLLPAAGFHALLPNMNLVQRLVIKHLRPAFRGKVRAMRVPGVRSWDPPIRRLKETDR